MIIYLNDILIFTWTFEDHHKAVCRVLEFLAEYWLYLCPKKYEFDRQQIEYLELVILEDQMEMKSVKVVSICN